MVTIIVKGGMVQEIVSNKKENAIVIDLDVEGTDAEKVREIRLLDGRKAAASVEQFKTISNIQFIKQVKSIRDWK